MKKIELLAVFFLIGVIVTSLFISVGNFIMIRQQNQRIDDIHTKVSNLDNKLSGLSIAAVILETND